ncbi:MAG: Lrp/AsnC family transcriptional regulator [Candidatus Thorarchaeota archaeon]|nr:MAG: Lrp/AsnC family transcriptional regulator [Candidatus Thorarchaeota archaeon]
MGSKERIDGYDEKIIRTLSENARSPLRDIGRQVKLSASSVRNRMERLLDRGIIERYTVDVNWRKMGYDIQVLLQISSWAGASREIYDKLLDYEAKDERAFHVTQVYRTSGPANVICIVRAKSMEDLASFITGELETLRGIERVDSMFLMPVPDH